MSREVCEHFKPINLPCEECNKLHQKSDVFISELQREKMLADAWERAEQRIAELEEEVKAWKVQATRYDIRAAGHDNLTIELRNRAEAAEAKLAGCLLKRKRLEAKLSRYEELRSAARECVKMMCDEPYHCIDDLAAALAALEE